MTLGRDGGKGVGEGGGGGGGGLGVAEVGRTLCLTEMRSATGGE